MRMNDRFTSRIRKRKKRINTLKTVLVTMAAIFFAVLFLTPIILTITNSFMSSSEISANYGSVFATTSKGGKVFVSKTVNLKFIPDMVTFYQYYTVLFKSPEYLFKFWNSIIYAVPIVVLQLGIATLASYGFARYDGRLKRVIFFSYIIMMLMPCNTGAQFPGFEVIGDIRNEMGYMAAGILFTLRSLSFDQVYEEDSHGGY